MPGRVGWKGQLVGIVVLSVLLAAFAFNVRKGPPTMPSSLVTLLLKTLSVLVVI